MILARQWIAWLLGVTAAFLMGTALGADWPTYQHDNGRSAITPERLKLPLALRWLHDPPHPPARGWGEPEPGQVWSYGIERVGKVRYDDAYHVAAVGDAIYFAASAENKVCALDAATGRVRWVVYTDAPPRLAPTVWRGRVYVGADDGVVRCLDAATGKVVWSFRAAPRPDRALGQGRVMSLWPVRTGVLVDDGVACFGAGLFPSEGLYLYAVRAEDGKLLWVNDSYDAEGRADITPQGYLLASRSKLILPSGRVTPAVFERGDGRLLFTIRGGRALSGGTYATLAGDRLYNGTQVLVAHDLERTEKDKYGHDIQGPAAFAFFQGRRIVVHQGTAYLATNSELLALPEAALARAAEEVDVLRKLRWDRRNHLGAYGRLQSQLATVDHRSPQRARLEKEIERLKPHHDAVLAAEKKLGEHLDRTCTWRLACKAPDALILAGGALFAGGQGRVVGVDAATGKQLWTSEVSGTARGLAVANGRLFASTTTGDIYCYTPQATAKPGAPKRLGRPAEASPYRQDKAGRACAATAEAILRDTGIQRGYCLILGGGDGRLAFELARRTTLSIYVLEPDAAKVATARQALGRAGLYGARVCVEQGSLASARYPSHFANLIVCQEGFLGRGVSTSARDLLRLLRPLGGVAYVGQPPAFKTLDGALKPDHVAAWLKGLAGANAATSVRGAWARITRGALKGAGEWSHQYADPGNTACSNDRLARAPFGILWFGDPGPRQMIDRHSRGPAPLCVGGRLFIEGPDVVMAYDAYNGLPLWERAVPGVGRQHMAVDCANLAATADSLFVAVNGKCLRLDAATGRTRRTYSVPAREDRQRRRWAWLAVSGGLLFGSRTETDRPFKAWPGVSGNTSEAIFALDAATGRARWVYRGKGILHTCIAVGGGMVFLVDRAVAAEQRERAIRERIRDPGQKDQPRLDRRGQPVERDARLVVALDAATGRKRWERPLDVTDCVVGPSKRPWAGGGLSLLCKGGVVLLCSSPWNGHFLEEWHAGRFSRRSIIALAADTGRVLWSGRKGYRSRPIVVGERIFAEPWAHDLRTGAPRMRRHPITGRPEKWTMWRGYGGCGMPAASATALFFRDGSIAYYDLAADEGIVRLGGQRPGCWINAISAGGLVLIPEGSAQCDCPYAIQCSMALGPKERSAAWAQFAIPKPLTPVEHIALNLGAPGDRRDRAGRLWVHCPNRVHKYRWLEARFTRAPNAGYFRHEAAAASMRGTDIPWVFASGARGLARFAVPLLDKGQARARYTVRLYFAEPEDVEPGRRLFHVSLQGRRVLENFDIVKEAGAPLRPVVKAFRGIDVAASLTVDLTPSGAPDGGLPVLCGLEAVRERP